MSASVSSLSDAIVVSYRDWVTSMEKELVSVRGSLGREIKDSLNKVALNGKGNLAHCEHVFRVLKKAEEGAMSLNWLKKMIRKAETWKRVLTGLESRVS